jgi:hypothetical protein
VADHELVVSLLSKPLDPHELLAAFALAQLLDESDVLDDPEDEAQVSALPLSADEESLVSE